MSAPPVFVSPGLLRRLIAMLYESLLLLGVVAIGFLLPHAVFSTLTRIAAPTHVLWIHLLLLLMLYYVWFWTHGGQTLALKTWKMKIVDHSGRPVRLMQAALRYLIAWPSLLLGGIGIFWALVDREHQFLHDRLAGTRIILTEAG
jgi:uncharacterized RDD family membrane protein YckC